MIFVLRAIPYSGNPHVTLCNSTSTVKASQEQDIDLRWPVEGILPIKRLDCSANGGPRVIGDDGIFSPKHGTVTDNSFRSVLSPNHAAQFSNTTESRMLTTGNLRSSNTIF